MVLAVGGGARRLNSNGSGARAAAGVITGIGFLGAVQYSNDCKRTSVSTKLDGANCGVELCNNFITRACARQTPWESIAQHDKFTPIVEVSFSSLPFRKEKKNQKSFDKTNQTVLLLTDS